VVDRPEVIRPLLSARDGILVVVAAPAGYGKTTAVGLWSEADERPFAWLRIDHLDNDPAHLLLHIATAVAGVHPVDRKVLRYLRGPGRSPFTDLVPALVSALEHCGPLVVVLDETDALSDPAAADALRALVDTAPPTTTMVLVGRRPPPFDLARRRLLNTVVEIGTSALKLTAEEAAAAFQAVSGCTDECVALAVQDKCEGWAAGVVLAARVMRDGADVHLLTGRNRLVADYLLEEVLSTRFRDNDVPHGVGGSRPILCRPARCGVAT
jgi:LuxR family maltose regulon positive regulatory protein